MHKSVSYIAILGSLALAPAIMAQEVIVESLGAATAFDAGALSSQDISLPSSMWRGTSVARATELMQNAPAGSDDPVVRTLVRAALLSPGVPPEGDREAFEAARLSAVMKLRDDQALQTLLTRNPALGQTPDARANIALSRMDGQAACAVSDEITTGRAEPKWARLRAVCHVLRDEMPAAELTKDLLRNRGYSDAPYYALLANMMGIGSDIPAPSETDDALIRFMRARVQGRVGKDVALDPATPADLRLKAFWEHLGELSAADTQAIMSDLAFDPNNPLASSSFDYVSASQDPSPRGVAQLYLLAQNGDPRAIAKLATKTNKPTAMMTYFKDQIAGVRANEQAEINLLLFANAAVARRDLSNLQRLYATLEGYPQQDRIALAADALGNGFAQGELGRDIDSRLAGDGETLTRARRDAVIALALGARLSDPARKALSGYEFLDGRKIKAGDRIMLEAAAKAGSSAEVALLSGEIMNGSPLSPDSLGTVIQALSDAGLYELAGQIAATDFLRDL